MDSNNRDQDQIVQYPGKDSTLDPGTPWMKYAGLVETGDPNSSLSIDEVVYGTSE